MELNQLVINSRYNFRQYASDILTAEVKRATLMSTCGLAIAQQVDPGVVNKHVAAFPSLPDGTAKDPARLTYLLFQTEANVMIAVAYAWIIASSIETTTVSSATVSVRISSVEDLPKIRAVLANAGYAVESATTS